MNIIHDFCTRAEAVGAVTHRAASGEEAARIIVRVCVEKAPCELLLHNKHTATVSELGPLSPNGVPTRLQRVLAAPALTEAPALPDILPFLHELCAAQDVRLVQEHLRDWLDGVDAGVSVALAGVADNGACLLDVTDEDSRLAGMIAESHIILLPVAALVPDMAATAPLLRALQAQSGMATCITGPSRTADIERVSATGVHGPLAVHIILMECPCNAEINHA